MNTHESLVVRRRPKSVVAVVGRRQASVVVTFVLSHEHARVPSRPSSPSSVVDRRRSSIRIRRHPTTEFGRSPVGGVAMTRVVKRPMTLSSDVTSSSRRTRQNGDGTTNGTNPAHAATNAFVDDDGDDDDDDDDVDDDTDDEDDDFNAKKKRLRRTRTTKKRAKPPTTTTTTTNNNGNSNANEPSSASTPGARGYWRREEERALRDAVVKHGIGAWEKMRNDVAFEALKSRTGVQLKDKWRNLIKFQHLRQEEAAKVPYKSAVRAQGGKKGSLKPGNDGKVGKKAPGGVIAKKAAGMKTVAAAATAATTTKGTWKSAQKAGGKKQAPTVSRDALKKQAPAKKAALSAKERLKATYARQLAEEEEEDDDDDKLDDEIDSDDEDSDDENAFITRGPRGKFAKAANVGKAKIMIKADTEATRVVEQLKAKRRDMVNEVEAAERELARMKTVVEEAEAVYSQARARVHEALIGMHHTAGENREATDDDDDDDDTDWDRYLAFGAHESGSDADEKDGVVAEAAQAAAEAHEAITSAKKPKTAPPVPDIDDDDATDRDDSEDEEIDEDLVRSDSDEYDEDERNMMRANEVLAAAGLPPMHEIEHILLTELKKLEAANAAVVHARLALEAVDAEFAEALSNVVQEDEHHDLEQHFAAIERESDSDEEYEEPPESPAPAPKSSAPAPAKKPKTKMPAAQAPSIDTAGNAGPGGRVVEDRRYGIYDARRYRTEAENDAEAAVAVKGGAKTAPKRKASASAPKVSADASKKKEAKIEPVSEMFWYEQPNVNAAKSAAAARKAPPTRAPPVTPGAIPQWRQKRTATRVTIGRPVAGPTSWAAIGQHIIHE